MTPPLLTEYLQSTKFVTCVLTPCRFTNNVLSTAQQIWLRKLGGAKSPVIEGANGIITAGKAKRSSAQSGQGGERCLRTSSGIYYNYICSGCNKKIKNILSRFKQLKEEENRRKATKALASGDSASTSDDEESDGDTTEEVLVFYFIRPYRWSIVSRQSVLAVGDFPANSSCEHEIHLQLLM